MAGVYAAYQASASCVGCCASEALRGRYINGLRLALDKPPGLGCCYKLEVLGPGQLEQHDLLVADSLVGEEGSTQVRALLRCRLGPQGGQVVEQDLRLRQRAQRRDRRQRRAGQLRLDGVAPRRVLVAVDVADQVQLLQARELASQRRSVVHLRGAILAGHLALELLDIGSPVVGDPEGAQPGADLILEHRRSDAELRAVVLLAAVLARHVPDAVVRLADELPIAAIADRDPAQWIDVAPAAAGAGPVLPASNGLDLGPQPRAPERLVRALDELLALATVALVAPPVPGDRALVRRAGDHVADRVPESSASRPLR